MTHPSSPQAPMTAERLEEIRASTAKRRPDEWGFWIDMVEELVASHDAITARVAEAEGHVDDMSMKLTEAQHRCEAAESELAAARKVEDGEVDASIQALHATARHWPRAAIGRQEMLQAADLLTRLSAALKEAEAKLETIRRARPPDKGHNGMKVPGIEEIVKTFNDAAYTRFGAGHKFNERAGLLAVFETHVKGMLAEAYIEGHVDCQKRVMDVSGNDYANRILAQLKEPCHD